MLYLLWCSEKALTGSSENILVVEKDKIDDNGDIAKNDCRLPSF